MYVSIEATCTCMYVQYVDLKKVQSFETNKKVWLRILVGWLDIDVGHDLLYEEKEVRDEMEESVACFVCSN